MEREKRLELTGENPQPADNQLPPIGANSAPAQASTSEKRSDQTPSETASLRPENTRSDTGLNTEFSPEIREIVERWLTLNPSIQAAIMSIVRNSREVPAPGAIVSAPTAKVNHRHAKGLGI